MHCVLFIQNKKTTSATATQELYILLINYARPHSPGSKQDDLHRICRTINRECISLQWTLERNYRRRYSQTERTAARCTLESAQFIQPMSHLRVVEAPVKGSAAYMRDSTIRFRSSAECNATRIKDQNKTGGGDFSGAAALFRCQQKQQGALVRKDRPDGRVRARERSCVGSNRRSAQAKKFAFQGLELLYAYRHSTSQSRPLGTKRKHAESAARRTGRASLRPKFIPKRKRGRIYRLR